MITYRLFRVIKCNYTCGFASPHISVQYSVMEIGSIMDAMKAPVASHGVAAITFVLEETKRSRRCIGNF